MGEQREVSGAEPPVAAIQSARGLRAKLPTRSGRDISLSPTPTGLARHFCGTCAAVAFQDDAYCIYCRSGRPVPGWTPLEGGEDPWLGRIIGQRYLITRRIARGVAARVYEAESLNIHRQFAIKIVDFGPGVTFPGSKVVRARLRREIAAMSRLRNPHIVRIFEVLTLSKDCVAVVMDYIHAPTLSGLLGDVGALSWARACRMMRQIASAGHAAHQAGLVHRDLKPANIMVEEIPGGDDFIHLLDFGIVWVEDSDAITNGFVGTPLYSSPEQARGGAIDRRSDIYSLGVIFFEMLVGHPPFESSKIREVLRMHVKEPAPGLQDSAPDRPFPIKLCQLVEKTLQKERHLRPPNLLALIDALDMILASAPDFAEGSGPTPRVGEPLSSKLNAGDVRAAGCDAPAITRPHDLISVATTPRPISRAAELAAESGTASSLTVMGHGVLEIFARSKPSLPIEPVMPVFISGSDYN